MSLQAHTNNTEVIVSTVFTQDEIRPLQQLFNFTVVFNPNEQNLTSSQLRETRVFRLRTQGVLAAKNEMIMLIEDHCEVTPNWLKSMQQSLSNQDCIAGGPVANGSKNSLYQWSLYWSEYASMMPPFAAKNLSYLSAVNSAYFKTALDTCKESWKDGFYDNEVHDALIRQGAKLCLAPEAIVHTSLPFSFNQTLVHLFTGGKRYGSYRGGSLWSLQRIARLFATLLVPTVLLLRVLKLVRKRQPKLLTTFFLASPILYILLGAWGFGELIGTMKGKD